LGSLTEVHKKVIIVLLLVLLPLVIYWNVQDFGFTNYDDHLYVTENYQVQEGLTWRGALDVFYDISTGNWHPLTMLSHMLDWELFGWKAGGHHWTNVLLHILNGVLLFLLLHRLTGALWRSALVAALFAVHPLNVESVAWVSERKNVLSSFFWFLTLLFYVGYARQPGWKRYLPVLICFVLGLMSKAMLVTLPFVLLLMDYWPLNRTVVETGSSLEKQGELSLAKVGWGRLIWEKTPLFFLTAVFSAVTLYAQHKISVMADLRVFPFTIRIFNAIQSYFLYIKKMFWPTDLFVFYPMGDVSIWNLLFAAIIIIIITLFCCHYYKKYAYLAVGWFWFLGTLTPVIGLVQVGAQSMADRYAYIPLIGLFLMFSFGLADLSKKIPAKKLIVAMSCFVLVILSCRAYNQVQYWENDERLYTHAIQKGGPHVILLKYLGLAMLDANKPEKAAALFRQAISKQNKNIELYNSLGVALIMMGKSAEAEEQFKKTLRFNSKAYLAHNNLGMIYLNQGKDDEAIRHFQEAIRLQPRLANAHYRLSTIYRKQNMREKVDDHYNEAIRYNPEFKRLK